ncbi:MAG: hypothetical protein ACTS6J_09375 [Burkholderiales bacterium]
MTKWIIGLVAIAAMAALTAAVAVAQATAPRKLAHDPFDLGMLQRTLQQLMHQTELKSAAVAPSADGTRASQPAAAQVQVPVLTAELRAVMTGGARPLVNLGGTILGIGDNVDGFRLVEVRERSAVFARDGNRVELPLGRKGQP